MKQLYRARHDKKIAGVCGGLGHYFRIDPTLIRLALIYLTMTFVGVPLLIYFIAALIMPQEPANRPAIEIKRFYRSKSNRVFGGICGGLSEVLNIDAILIRLGFALLLFITGIFPLLVSYIVGCIIIPEK